MVSSNKEIQPFLLSLIISKYIIHCESSGRVKLVLLIISYINLQATHRHHCVVSASLSLCCPWHNCLSLFAETNSRAVPTTVLLARLLFPCLHFLSVFSHVETRPTITYKSKNKAARAFISTLMFHQNSPEMLDYVSFR